jgi:alkanesulfonate monooxygenase SsuD/methylene tetrahydromethanopterin reductase-like flavin-dependent oxidoreductase (luciferase family)
MRFGIFGGPRAKANASTTQNAAGYADFVEYILQSEKMGFVSAFVVEHHFSGLGQVSSTLELLSYLAARTSTLRLGTAVTVLPWHNPVLLAEQIATLDVLSAGRVDLGIGRGYRPNEFHGFSIDPAEAEERFEECLAVMMNCWTSSEPFSHRGLYWDFRDVVVEPRPWQQPHVPIWIGAGSKASVQSAGARRFRLLLDQFGDIEQTKDRIDWYRSGVEDAGGIFNPQDIALTRALMILFDDESREQLDHEYERRIAGIRLIRERSQIPGAERPLTAADHAFFNEAREATVAAVIGGSPRDCIDRLKELEKAGVDLVLLNDPLLRSDRLRLFADKVMTEF